MIEKKIIETEDQAYEILKSALSEASDFDERLQISFDGWPSIKIKFEGDDFNGGLPSRMLEPLIELQKTIYRVYCRSKYDSDDLRKLTQKDKEALELVVIPTPGCTDVLIELGGLFNEIIQSSNMNGTETTIVIVAAGVLFTASVAWKNWLNNKREEHADENTVKLSQQETERLKIVSDALTANPSLNEIKQEIEQFRSDLTKKLKPNDRIFVGGDNEQLLNGEEAAELSHTPREKSVETRIDGEFLITEVKFPRTLDEKYIFYVERVSDGLELKVAANRENLTMDQITILKEGGFGMRKVIMAINAKLIRDTYSHAKLYSISWPKKD